MDVRPGAELRAEFGGIDIYLFDQLLRGRFDGRRKILDAGCGDGRNLTYFLRAGFACCGVDRDPSAVARAASLAGTLRADMTTDQFQVADLDRLPWEDGAFDAVICSAVLHFAEDEPRFGAIVAELWRVLAPGGLFFARLASSIGLEPRLPRSRGRVRLPDGSDRFVVDEPLLVEWTNRLGARLLDPIKTTNVQGQRCMTTWVLEKGGAPA